jgi:uncharacterized membrane protein YoaK (UPF0700 family)
MSKDSWDRRYAFLLGLTGAAGALDALSFLYLGKVFTSFQSGNVLFVGIGAGSHDSGLVLRAGVVLALFFAGTALGARLVGTRLRPEAKTKELTAVAIETALLTAFAVLWLALGTPAKDSVLDVALLALAGLAMGIQAALVMALKIPNVVTVALTATVGYLAQRVGAGSVEGPRDADLPSSWLLTALILTYLVCAVVVALLPKSSALSLIPLLLLAAGVTLDQLRSRTSAARTSAAVSSRSSAAR